MIVHNNVMCGDNKYVAFTSFLAKWLSPNNYLPILQLIIGAAIWNDELFGRAIVGYPDLKFFGNKL